jgi:PRTRC genetic system protein A
MSSSIVNLPKLVGHRIAVSQDDPVEAALYEYLLSGNGLFVRAKRREFSVSLPLSLEHVRGLPNASIGVSWKRPRIYESLWREILQHARDSYSSSEFKEELYLINWDDATNTWNWKAAGRNSSSVTTIADDSLPEYTQCCIELHTHPPCANHFSKADDRDELGKFRIFAILIDIHDKPKIRFRCGVYEHLVPIPAAWVGEMPEEIIDLNEIDELLEMLSS